MKKSEAKILESPIFDLQKHNIPQKKPKKIVIKIWNKIRDFCYEKIENKSIQLFLLQKICNFSSVLVKFLKNQ